MKKKLLLFVSFLAGLLFLISTSTYASKLPKGYGIAKTFTTPKATVAPGIIAKRVIKQFLR